MCGTFYAVLFLLCVYSFDEECNVYYLPSLVQDVSHIRNCFTYILNQGCLARPF
jgi:hypothetical protein